MKKDDRRLSAIVIFRAYFRFHLYPNKTFCFICLGYKRCFDGHLNHTLLMPSIRLDDVRIAAVISYLHLVYLRMMLITM